MKKGKSVQRIREKKGIWTSPGGKGEIVLYKSPDGKSALEVHLEQETVWLSLKQIADLFSRDKSVISRHLRNVFQTNELDVNSTVALFATVQKEGGREVERKVEFYNLDAIISVGYRVNTKRGTQFRIWATNVLRDHIVKGHTRNEKRLKELKQSLQLVEHVLDRHDIGSDEAKGLLRVVTDYERALDILDDYDHQRIQKPDVAVGPARGISYDEAIGIIGRLKAKFGSSGLFGREKDQSLHSSLGAVMQTFGGKDLYPGLEEKAAHLLYFIVKNHSFVDGNKRIAAALFLWFMEKNGILYRADGTKRIADNALVAITLLIAESDPKQKKFMTSVVMNLIDQRNN
ncbi:MAG TPA: virulence protein RhuM/Fic/DOC family protein [Candidatus Aminicenantes bacterium]|nr:virulence protein RhuM/Fic/DOC family protein [Candidatus Aminicenantes bacterium]HQH46078.1 virulence protein RhuM/Fic/DOC family protein [Candidatus Aminicenantes bacterium]